MQTIRWSLFFEEDGTTETMKIRHHHARKFPGRPGEHGIPIGRALLGHREGDRVYVEVNSSYGYYVVVRSIRKTIDDGSDKIRSFEEPQALPANRPAGWFIGKGRERNGYENYLYRAQRLCVELEKHVLLFDYFTGELPFVG